MTCVDRVRLLPSSRSRLVPAGLLLAFLAVPVLPAAQSGGQIPVDRELPAFDRVQDARAYANVPAHVAIVDGIATLEREGLRERLEEGVPLLAGDRIRTDRGRVEVLFDDGSAIDVDQFSGIDFMSESLLRLAAGRVRVSIARVTNAADYRVDGAGVTAWLQGAGEYRVGLRTDRGPAGELELTVFRGLAELETPVGRTRLRAGQQAYAVATAAPSPAQVANASAVDEFDQWSEDQRDARLGVTSAQYLPAEVRAYSGAFDTYGSWEYLPAYGNVWYPRVDVGWRPYYHGRWSFYASFGWTWIGGGYRWGYPTHHYGRWGVHGSRWYWVPGRHWSPAWVSWAYAPNYIGWCPLGYNSLPVVHVSHVNVYPVKPWHAWTVVPSRSFVHNVHVSNHVVSSGWAVSRWSEFAERSAAPARPANVVATRTAPLLAPSRGQAVSRAGAVGGVPGQSDRDVAPVRRASSPGAVAAPGSRTDGDGFSRVAAPSTQPGGASVASRSRAVAPSDVRPSVETQPPAETARARSRVPSAAAAPPASRDRTTLSRTIDPDAARSREVMPSSRWSSPRSAPSTSSSTPRARERSAPAPSPSSAPPTWSPRESSRPSRVAPAGPRSVAPPSGGASRAAPRSSSPPPSVSGSGSGSPSRSSPATSQSSGSSGRTSSGSSSGQAVRRGGR